MFLLGTFVFAGLFVLYSTYDILKTEDKKKTKKGTLSSRGYTSREVNEARQRERTDRGLFLPLGKKVSSYRGAYRVPLFN